MNYKMFKWVLNELLKWVVPLPLPLPVPAVSVRKFKYSFSCTMIQWEQELIIINVIQCWLGNSMGKCNSEFSFAENNNLKQNNFVREQNCLLFNSHHSTNKIQCNESFTRKLNVCLFRL